MKKPYVKFFINSESADVEADFNGDRIQAHLKAMLRGHGSSTENIVIGFVKDDTKYITKYGDPQDAFDRLDGGQKKIIDAFRSLLGKPHLDAVGNKAFPDHWLAGLVRNNYFVQYELNRSKSVSEEYEPSENEMRLMAQKAEKDELLKFDLEESPAFDFETWVIDYYDDED